MTPIPTVWWLRPGQQRWPRRRAQRRRVEAVVLQTLSGQPLGRRRRARPAERARRGEADVVEQDDKHVRRSGRRPQRLDRRERRVRVLRVERKRSVDTAGPGSEEHRALLGTGSTRDRLSDLFASVDANSAELDSPATPRPPGCDGRGHDRGLRNRRGAGCDGLGHDRGLRHRVADDTDSSYTSWSERHFSLLPSQALHRPRWRR